MDLDMNIQYPPVEAIGRVTLAFGDGAIQNHTHSRNGRMCMYFIDIKR